MNNTEYKRRKFIKHAAVAGVAGLTLPHLSFAAAEDSKIENKVTNRPKVLFFDVNETILDLTQMKKSVGKALGGRSELLSLWFTTMLQYSLVTTAGRQYFDFGTIGAATLQMVAKNNGITLSDAHAKDAVVTPLRSIPPHPEVKAALERFKKAGFTMVSFTNSSNIGVKTQIENAGLIDLFEQRLSIEDIGKFKPDFDAYNWAARKMSVKPSECLLVAAHGWDIAGALWAGWRAAFISRPGAQLFPLAPNPEISAANLTLIADQLIALK